MNIKDFATRWALHYVNPDFMKIPASGDTYSGSGFFLNFTLRKSPHLDAKWCVTDFYLYDMNKKMYIIPKMIKNDGQLFENFQLQANSLPQKIREQIDVENCTGYTMMGHVDFRWVNKHITTEVEVCPTIIDAPHTVYLQLPKGKYRYTEYSCYGGKLFRRNIVLISEPNLHKNVLVNIPHEAIYYSYKLTNQYYNVQGSIDVENKDFEDYLTDKNATLQTSHPEDYLTTGEEIQATIINVNKGSVSRVLNQDFYYESNTITTSMDWSIRYLKILEKKYVFTQRALEEQYHNYDYTIDPNITSSVRIKQQNKTTGEKIPYELAVAKWNYSGESLNDKDLSGTSQNFGGAKKVLNQDGSVKNWEIGSLIVQHDSPYSTIHFNDPKEKEVLEPILYHCPINSDQLTYKLNLPSLSGGELSAINEISDFMTHARSQNRTYINQTSYTRVNFTYPENSYSSRYNITFSHYQNGDKIGDPYHYYSGNLPKTLWDDYQGTEEKSTSYSSCNLVYYARVSNEGYHESDNNYSRYSDYNIEWRAYAITPIFMEYQQNKVHDTFDNRDVIDYGFSPQTLSYYFYYHSGNIALTSDFDSLPDDEDDFYYGTSRVFMDPPNVSVIEQAPYLHIKDGYSSANGWIDTDVTLYSYQWTARSLDRIWRHQQFAEGHFIVDTLHNINNGDGTWSEGIGPEISSGNNSKASWELQQKGRWYFEISTESIYDTNYSGVPQTVSLKRDPSDPFSYITTNYSAQYMSEHGTQIVRGRHWSAMIGNIFQADGWPSDYSRKHQMYAVNLARANQVAESYTLNISSLYSSNYVYPYEFTEGEYYWCCLGLIGYINEIYINYLTKFKEKWDKEHDSSDYPSEFPIEETDDSIFFLTLKGGEIRYNKVISDNESERSAYGSINRYVVPYINTPEYYSGHDLGKMPEFEGYLSLGEQLKERPKFQINQDE